MSRSPLAPNSSALSVISPLSRVSSFEPFVSLFWERTVNAVIGETPTQDDWIIHRYGPSLHHIKASTRKYQKKPCKWKHYTVRPVLIRCHWAVCSWVPKPKWWQSPEETTANKFAVATSPPLLWSRGRWSVIWGLPIIQHSVLHAIKHLLSDFMLQLELKHSYFILKLP